MDENLVIREEMLLLHAQTVKPIHVTMYWTLELASKLEDAPWPATKEELIDYAMRSGAPLEVVENLEELEDEGEIYETIEDVWPDYPTKEDSSSTKTNIDSPLSAEARVAPAFFVSFLVALPRFLMVPSTSPSCRAAVEIVPSAHSEHRLPQS